MKHVLFLLGFVAVSFAGDLTRAGEGADLQKEYGVESVNSDQKTASEGDSEEAGAYNFEFEEAEAEEHARFEEEKKTSGLDIDVAGDIFSAYYNLN